MLDNRFTRSEGAGYAIGSAERNGKKRIDETYLRNHRVRRRKAFGIAVDGAFYRPLERHRNRMRFALFVFEDCDFILNRVRSRRCDFLYGIGAVHIEGYEDFMRKGTFGNRADGISAVYGVSDFCRRRKIPLRRFGKRVDVDAPLEKKACLFRDERQRILQTVVHLTEQTGTEFGAQKVAVEFDGIARTYAVRHFVNLHLSAVAAYTDDFAFEPFAFDVYVADFVHRNVAVKGYRNHIAVDADYFRFSTRHIVSPSIESYIVRYARVPASLLNFFMRAVSKSRMPYS